ncbi:helix-turn-helix domain-containing protein [Mycolicibacter virginiensis]|uniref:helix-turn-helix domain-containing protein n=1 Tax=Mycolicibacter virginiensis TaxID=1795032 RepID=UPI003313DECF
MTPIPGPEPVPEPRAAVLDRGRGLGLDDVAAAIGKSVKTARRLALSGEIPAYRIGLKITIFEADLNDFIDSRRILGGAA